MSEKILIEQCSPTLAAIKTGSMFLYPYASIGEMRAAVRGWNKRLRDIYLPPVYAFKGFTKQNCIFYS